MTSGNEAPDSEATAAALPSDLRLALVCWYRAQHHGSQQEEIDADEMLSIALSKCIKAMRDVTYAVVAPQQQAAAPMIEVGVTSRGSRLYRQQNGAGGHSYWSDSIGGGVIIYDTCLAAREELEMALRIEGEFERGER